MHILYTKGGKEAKKAPPVNPSSPESSPSERDNHPWPAVVGQRKPSLQGTLGVGQAIHLSSSTFFRHISSPVSAGSVLVALHTHTETNSPLSTSFPLHPQSFGLSCALFREVWGRCDCGPCNSLVAFNRQVAVPVYWGKHPGCIVYCLAPDSSTFAHKHQPTRAHTATRFFSSTDAPSPTSAEPALLRPRTCQNPRTSESTALPTSLQP